MKLDKWQLAKNTIKMIEKLEERKFELSLLLDSIISNKHRPIYIQMDTYPNPSDRIPLYNDEKIIEFIKFQLEDTEKLLDQRKKEFDKL